MASLTEKYQQLAKAKLEQERKMREEEEKRRQIEAKQRADEEARRKMEIARLEEIKKAKAKAQTAPKKTAGASLPMTNQNKINEFQQSQKKATAQDRKDAVAGIKNAGSVAKGVAKGLTDPQSWKAGAENLVSGIMSTNKAVRETFIDPAVEFVEDKVDDNAITKGAYDMGKAIFKATGEAGLNPIAQMTNVFNKSQDALKTLEKDILPVVYKQDASKGDKDIIDTVIRSANESQKKILERADNMYEKFGIGAGISTVDNTVRAIPTILTGASGKMISLALAGVSVAGREGRMIANKGYEPRKAVAIGVAKGAIEVITEIIGVDNIIDAISIAGKGTVSQLLEQALKSSWSEGLEEGLSYTMNYVLDQIVMEAKDKPDFDLNELAENVLSGALSGLIGVGGAVMTHSNYSQYDERFDQKEFDPNELAVDEDFGIEIHPSQIQGDKRNVAQVISSIVNNSNKRLHFFEADPRIQGSHQNGVIWINLNSQDGIEFTVKHELLHSIRDTEYYEQLVDFAREFYTIKGVNFDDIVAEVIQERSEYAESQNDDKFNVTVEDAVEEVVGDFIGKEIFTGNAIMDLAITRRSAFKFITDFVNEKFNNSVGGKNNVELQAQKAFKAGLKASGSVNTDGTIKHSVANSKVAENVDLYVNEYLTKGNIKNFDNYEVSENEDGYVLTFKKGGKTATMLLNSKGDVKNKYDISYTTKDGKIDYSFSHKENVEKDAIYLTTLLNEPVMPPQDKLGDNFNDYIEKVGNQEQDAYIYQNWYRGGDPTYRDIIATKLAKNPEYLNASIYNMYLGFKDASTFDSSLNANMSYQDFLETPITLYRGGHEITDDVKHNALSFTFLKDTASYFKKWHSKDTAYEITITPKETLGHPIERGTEYEILVPSAVLDHPEKYNIKKYSISDLKEKHEKNIMLNELKNNSYNKKYSISDNSHILDTLIGWESHKIQLLSYMMKYDGVSLGNRNVTSRVFSFINGYREFIMKDKNEHFIDDFQKIKNQINKNLFEEMSDYITADFIGNEGFGLFTKDKIKYNENLKQLDELIKRFFELVSKDENSDIELLITEDTNIFANGELDQETKSFNTLIKNQIFAFFEFYSYIKKDGNIFEDFIADMRNNSLDEYGFNIGKININPFTLFFMQGNKINHLFVNSLKKGAVKYFDKDLIRTYPFDEKSSINKKQKQEVSTLANIMLDNYTKLNNDNNAFSDHLREVFKDGNILSNDFVEKVVSYSNGLSNMFGTNKKNARDKIALALVMQHKEGYMTIYGKPFNTVVRESLSRENIGRFMSYFSLLTYDDQKTVSHFFNTIQKNKILNSIDNQTLDLFSDDLYYEIYDMYSRVSTNKILKEHTIIGENGKYIDTISDMALLKDDFLSYNNNFETSDLYNKNSVSDNAKLFLKNYYQYDETIAGTEIEKPSDLNYYLMMLQYNNMAIDGYTGINGSKVIEFHLDVDEKVLVNTYTKIGKSVTNYIYEKQGGLTEDFNNLFISRTMDISFDNDKKYYRSNVPTLKQAEEYLKLNNNDDIFNYNITKKVNSKVIDNSITVINGYDDYVGSEEQQKRLIKLEKSLIDDIKIFNAEFMIAKNKLINNFTLYSYNLEDDGHIASVGDFLEQNMTETFERIVRKLSTIQQIPTEDDLMDTLTPSVYDGKNIISEMKRSVNGIPFEFNVAYYLFKYGLRSINNPSTIWTQLLYSKGIEYVELDGR